MKLISLVITLTLVVGVNSAFAAIQPRDSLKEKVSRADAIVIGHVADIEKKWLSVTMFKRNSDGKLPQMTSFYDLAVVHTKTALKTDSEALVNRANKSNPTPWMHMAYQTPGQNLFGDSTRPIAGKGERRIWFLRRDTVMTGHYFLVDAEQVTDVRIQELKKLVVNNNRLQPGKLAASSKSNDTAVNERQAAVND